ncbi:MAG: Fe-S protein assembly co-chaperone HscB [Myxococcales bacterium]|nr:Fe-S protein assembly co-chaperone HscB [Myxococcales bacterium]
MLDKFALLGVPQGFDEPPGIDEKFRELSRKMHPDRVPPKQRVKAAGQMTALNDAYKTLKDPVRRAEHFLTLKGFSGEVKMSPEFLQQTLDDREELDEAKASGKPLQDLARSVREKRDQTLAQVREIVTKNGDLEKAAELLARMKYYARYLDEVEGREAEV